jgi:hypothetical protein
MLRTPARLILAVALGATLLAAGCGGGSKSPGDKAAFCKDDATLNTASAKATSLADVVTIFKANAATIDDFAKQAPADIKDDATTLVTAAHKVISSGDATLFGGPTTEAAGKRVDAYCSKSTATT